MMERKIPPWIKVKALHEEVYRTITSVSKKYNLHTVCQEAKCPNIGKCWSEGSSTFLLLGDVCTRNCKFCSVKTGNPNGFLDNNEPANVAKAVKEFGLNYVILTSVDRDDLPDGGAEHFSKTVNEISKLNPNTLIEVLIPDFSNNISSLEMIINSKAYIIGHNIETVKSFTSKLRDHRAGYDSSLNVLAKIKEINHEMLTKSAIMLGLGEKDFEVKETLEDLRNVNVDIIVIGQYLRSEKSQIPVYEYVTPEKFEGYAEYAKDLGFQKVISFPLARSSYRVGLYDSCY